jgi:16S rRNA C967 or C1407 C5-methylase (RsmB/RsmF family)
MNSWNPSRTRIQSRRQFALLTSAIKAVREGGTIVYATCSMSAFENDNVVEKAVRKTRFNVVVDTSKKWPIGEATKFVFCYGMSYLQRPLTHLG